MKKDASEEVLINQLYKYTPLQSNFNVMNVALVDGRPRTLSLIDMLRLYVDYRMEVIYRRTRYLLRKARQKAHILEGLILAMGDIDEIIELIKTSPDPATAKDRLMARGLRLAETGTLHRLLPEAFVSRVAGVEQHLTGVQAQAILSMQLQKLTGLEVEKLAKEYGDLVEEIEGYEAILSDEALVYDIIREDLHEMKDKFPTARRTGFMEEVGDYAIEELIPDEPCIVTLTHAGYIKRVDVDTYRKQGRGGIGVKGGTQKDDDFIEHLFAVSTHDHLLVFTDQGRVYWARVFALPAGNRLARGRSIANVVQFQPGERHCAVLPVKEFEEAFVFFATSRGVVKKTPLAAYSRPRATGIIAIGLDDGDSIVNVVRTDGEDDIVLGSRSGMAIRFHESDVRAMGRTARGVNGMNLSDKDLVISMEAIKEGGSLLTICSKGYGKRTSIDEYRKTRRGGKGVINIRGIERNGEVVSISSVKDDDELMLITSKGMMLRIGLDSLREIGRATQGVRIIRLKDPEDTVVAVARLAHTDEEGEPEHLPNEDDGDTN